ncbi:MAG: aminopeptidase P family protein [Candidatus Taylorbacteria bacterium]|nr:aminopeptidase P family protein [Candidatus Taylorbacteria bacterium]
MKSRWLKVKKLLKAEKCDALLVINAENNGQPGTRYLSGFSGSSSVLLITKEKKILVTDSRYTVQVRQEAKGFEVTILKPRETFRVILKHLAAKLHLKKILIDGGITSYASVESLKKAVPKMKVTSKNGLLQELRIVKDKQEIALLKKAAAIASRAFLKFLPSVKAGVLEKSLAARLEAICKEEGADKMAFDTIVASGGRAALPHARPSGKKLRKGELVVIDWGVRYQGYVSDMTRTIAIGKIAPRLREIYEAVRGAQERGCQAARAGLPARALDAACRETLKEHGLEKYFAHAAGHGIGMEIHELPVVGPKQNEPLPAGAVITCEPGVYIPRLGGARIEDSLIITKRGVVSLTKALTKKLIIIN